MSRRNFEIVFSCGMSEYGRGQFAVATVQFQKALTLATEETVAQTKAMLALSLLRQGNYAEAAMFFDDEETRAYLRQSYDPHNRLGPDLTFHDQYSFLLPIPNRLRREPEISVNDCSGSTSFIQTSPIAPGIYPSQESKHPVFENLINRPPVSNAQRLSNALVEQARELILQAARVVQIEVFPNIDYEEPDLQTGIRIGEELDRSYKYPRAVERLQIAESKLRQAAKLLDRNVSPAKLINLHKMLNDVEIALNKRRP